MESSVCLFVSKLRVVTCKVIAQGISNTSKRALFVIYVILKVDQSPAGIFRTSFINIYNYSLCYTSA